MELNLDAELDAILKNSVSDKDTSVLFVDSLDRYLNKIESLMNNWLDEFEWNRETLFKSQSGHGLVCPFNEAHRRITPKNFARHVQRCRLKSLNFSKLNIVDYYKQPLVDSLYQIADAHAGHSTEILFDSLNQSEKLRLYDHAIDKSKENKFPVNSNWNEQTFHLNSTKKTNETNTLTEKDKKRRPKSYQTSKCKSYTDTIRELIHSQMQVLQTEHDNYSMRLIKNKTRKDMSIDSSQVSNYHRSRSRSRNRQSQYNHYNDHKKNKNR